MADYKKLIPFILRWEGGFVNDPHDAGGATNKGVTLATYEAYCRAKGYPRPTVERLRNLTHREWEDIYKTMYWDRWQADHIHHQPIANILVDWLWMSGEYGIKIPQRLLGVDVDGRVGTQTLAAINAQDPRTLFDNLKAARIGFINDICHRRPRNERFRRGWLNRLNALTYEE